MRTPDLARLEHFYVGVLGLTELRRDDGRGSVWLDAGGTVLMLERAAPGEPPVPPGSHELLAFAIDASARDAWRARITRRGRDRAHALLPRSGRTTPRR